MSARIRPLLVLIAAALAACSSGTPMRGPPDPAEREPEAPAYRLGASYARAAAAPAAKALVAKTTRADAALPATQNWEASLVVTHRDADSADRDALMLVWMDGRPGADGLRRGRVLRPVAGNQQRSCHDHPAHEPHFSSAAAGSQNLQVVEMTGSRPEDFGVR